MVIKSKQQENMFIPSGTRWTGIFVVGAVGSIKLKEDGFHVIHIT